MPAELSPYRVGNSSDKLPSEAQVSTQLPGKLLWTVHGVGEAPFKLVYQRDVTHMDIQLHVQERTDNKYAQSV